MAKQEGAPVHNVNGVKRILSTHDEEALRTDIIEWLMNGYSRQQIVKFYSETRDLSERYVEEKYKDAVSEIKKRAGVDNEIVFHVHVELYETIYQFFEENDNVYGKRKALYGKEKLLGLHKEETNLEVNNTTNFELQTEAIYDTKKLLPDEQTRLNTILQKIGQNDNN